MNILILSRNSALYSTRSLVDASRKRGHYVRVIDHLQCDLLIDRNRLEVYYQDEKISGFDAVIPRIGTTATRYGASVVRQFEQMGLFSTLNHEALLRTRNKLSSLQLLAANGIGVPKSVVNSNLYTIDETLDLIGEYPLIVKMEKGTHGLGVVLSENRQNAVAVMESFYKLKQRTIIQEYIEEAKGSDVRVFIVDGTIVGVMQRQAAKGEFRSNLHRGGRSFVVRLTDEEAYACKQAAKIMGTKVCGVDMLRSKKGPLILEVNASPGLEGIENTTKNDIAGKIVRFCERNVKKSTI